MNKLVASVGPRIPGCKVSVLAKHRDSVVECVGVTWSDCGTSSYRRFDDKSRTNTWSEMWCGVAWCRRTDSSTRLRLSRSVHRSSCSVALRCSPIAWQHAPYVVFCAFAHDSWSLRRCYRRSWFCLRHFQYAAPPQTVIHHALMIWSKYWNTKIQCETDFLQNISKWRR
jgi:hypothetical protein